MSSGAKVPPPVQIVPTSRLNMLPSAAESRRRFVFSILRYYQRPYMENSPSKLLFMRIVLLPLCPTRQTITVPSCLNVTMTTLLPASNMDWAVTSGSPSKRSVLNMNSIASLSAIGWSLIISVDKRSRREGISAVTVDCRC